MLNLSNAVSQYFSVPHRFPQESWGINRQEFAQESTGMDWNGPEFTGID